MKATLNNIETQVLEAVKNAYRGMPNISFDDIARECRYIHIGIAGQYDKIREILNQLRKKGLLWSPSEWEGWYSISDEDAEIDAKNRYLSREW